MANLLTNSRSCGFPTGHFPPQAYWYNEFIHELSTLFKLPIKITWEASVHLVQKATFRLTLIKEPLNIVRGKARKVRGDISRLRLIFFIRAAFLWLFIQANFCCFAGTVGTYQSLQNSQLRRLWSKSWTYALFVIVTSIAISSVVFDGVIQGQEPWNLCHNSVVSSQDKTNEINQCDGC